MSGFRLSDYDYFLETERIAQQPISERDHARLMVLDRRSGTRFHRRFLEITDFLKQGDLLVFNDTRVIRARLRAKKETGGDLEILLLRDLGGNRWEALIRGKVKEGTIVILETGEKGRVEETRAQGQRVLGFSLEKDLYSTMARCGSVPLPPYIHRNGDQSLARFDQERYQTVYARTPGAVAAPTAGLHFTNGLISRIREKGVQTVFVTLHVGYGTFKPVTEEDIRMHRMDEEVYSISEQACSVIHDAVQEERRIIAVGTTSTRALESASDDNGNIVRPSGNTDLFIYPGYRWRLVQGLITNFHLPRSTLLMLVAAFAGKAPLDQAYAEAREMNYRFYSYGDAMLVL